MRFYLNLDLIDLRTTLTPEAFQERIDVKRGLPVCKCEMGTRYIWTEYLTAVVHRELYKAAFTLWFFPQQVPAEHTNFTNSIQHVHPLPRKPRQPPQRRIQESRNPGPDP